MGDEVVEFKAMIYGPPGTGKTTFAASGVNDPRCWPGLIIDLENGVTSVRSKVRTISIDDIGTLPQEEGKYDRVKLDSWSQLSDVYNNLLDNPIYKLVIVDTITEAAYMCLNDIVMDKRDDRGGKEVPELQDYNVSLTRMRKLVRYFLKLDCLVILTGAATVNINPKTKLPRAEPAFQGKLISEVPHLVTTLGYFDAISPDERVMYVSADEKFYAKDRSEDRALGSELINPTLPQVLDLISGDSK